MTDHANVPVPVDAGSTAIRTHVNVVPKIPALAKTLASIRPS